MNKYILEREKVWEEYVNSLNAEIDEMRGYAMLQGWKSSRLEKFKELRKKLGIEYESEKNNRP